MTDDHTPQSPEDRRIAQAFDRLNQDTHETVLPSRSLARLHKQSRPWVRAVAPALGTVVVVAVVIGLFGLFQATRPEAPDVVDTLPQTTTTVAPTTTLAPPPATTTTTVATTTTSAPVAAAPQTYRVVGVDANDVLNVRAEPDIGAPIIGFFAPDATGIRTTGTIVAGWLEVITTDGGLGWASTEFLRLEGGPGYRVVGVAPGDTLAVRSGPGVSNPKIGDLAPDATDVQLTGLASAGTEPWWEIVLPNGTRGWSSSEFLRLPAEWDADFDAVPCSGLRSAYGLDSTHSGQTSEADAVLAVGLATDLTETCTRTVITLGVGQGPTASGWSGEPTDTVPGDVAVSVDGQVVTVELPGVIDARPVAVTTATAEGEAYVVRADDGNLSVAIHAREPVLVRSMLLEDPARIVIDAIASGAGSPRTFSTGPLVLTAPAMPANGGPVTVTGTTLRVAGYARPFESSGVAQLREAAASPGAGDRVIVQWETLTGKVVGFEISYPTTDAVTAWGHFEFTITDLRPGSYELFVGAFDAATGDPVGMYVPLEVTP